MPESAVKQETKTKLKKPTMYKVIYMNDDRTTYEFVTQSLMEVFGYDFQDAHDKTIEVDKEGSAVVAVMPYEIAEQKALEVIRAARSNNFPFVVRVEEE